MTNKNKKKIDPAISQVFRDMQKKSWASRKKKLLEKPKAENCGHISQEYKGEYGICDKCGRKIKIAKVASISK